MRRILTLGLALIAAFFIVTRLTPVAYGQTNDAGAAPIQIEPADPAAAPTAQFYGGAICAITPGDLFYLNAADTPMDINATLTITNPENLVHYFRYLILNIVVYADDNNGNWIVSQIPETYLTLNNGSITLTLPGGTNYKVAVNGGSANCLPYVDNNGFTLPNFFLEAEPA
jgi:hypothetical protein